MPPTGIPRRTTTYNLSESVYRTLQDLSEQTGLTNTDIVEFGLRQFNRYLAGMTTEEKRQWMISPRKEEGMTTKPAVMRLTEQVLAIINGLAEETTYRWPNGDRKRGYFVSKIMVMEAGILWFERYWKAPPVIGPEEPKAE